LINYRFIDFWIQYQITAITLQFQQSMASSRFLSSFGLTVDFVDEQYGGRRAN